MSAPLNWLLRVHLVPLARPFPRFFTKRKTIALNRPQERSVPTLLYPLPRGYPGSFFSPFFPDSLSRIVCEQSGRVSLLPDIKPLCNISPSLDVLTQESKRSRDSLLWSFERAFWTLPLVS